MKPQFIFHPSPGSNLYRFGAFFVFLSALVAHPNAARADYLWYHDLRGDFSINQVSSRSTPDSSIVDNAGDIIVSGFLQRKNGEIVTVAYDKTGAPLWSQSVPATPLERSHLVTNSKGDILVLLQESSGRPPTLIRYSGHGALISKTTLDAGLPDTGLTSTTLLVDSADNIYLCASGYTFDGNELSASFLVVSKYDSDLTRLWTRTDISSSNAGETDLLSAALDVGGNVIVTGYEKSDGEILLGKYDTDGNLLFLRVLTGEQAPNYFILFLTTDEEGSIYLSGIHQYDVSHARLVITKYSSAGEQDWVRSDDGGAYPGDYYDAGPIIIDASGDLVVSGDIYTPAHVGKRSLIKYDSDGNRLWIHRTSRDYAGSQRVVGLFSDENSNVYVVEQVVPKLSVTRSFPHGIVGVSELDSAGNSVWRQNYLGAHVHPDSAVVTSSAFDASSGILYVSGTSDFNPVTTRQLLLEKDWFTVAFQP